MTLAASLWALALSAFVSATLFPGASEAALAAVLAAYPGEAWAALAAAGAANTAGAMTTYCLGRFIPQKKCPSQTLERLRRYGTPLLFFTWLPVIGDALSLGAGWLKLNPAAVLLWTAAGKFLRYGAVTLAFYGLWPL